MSQPNPPKHKISKLISPTTIHLVGRGEGSLS